MAKMRGAQRYFRVGREPGTAYGVPPTYGYNYPNSTASTYDMRFFQVSEGNFSLKRTPVVEEQQVLRGKLGVAYRESTGQSVAGDIGVLMHPETVKWWTDFGFNRDASEELPAYTFQEFYPTISSNNEFGTSYVGCKCNQISGAWGTGNPRATLTMSVMGQREIPYDSDDDSSATIPTTNRDSWLANSISDNPLPSHGYFFNNSALVDMSTTGLVLPTCDFTEVSFQVANNLAEGPRCFDPDTSLRGAITDLIAGQERISGSLTLQWKDDTILSYLRNFTDLGLRNIFIHPSAKTACLIDETTGATTSSVEVDTATDPTIAASGSIAADDVIAIQHADSSAFRYNWSTAKANAVGAGSVTLDDLDIGVEAGDTIWSEAMEITFPKINITDVDKTGGPEDAVVTVTATFEGKADAAAGQISTRVKGGDPYALPITSAPA